MEEQRFEPGTVVAGKYEIQRKLGSGGMGVVLAVRHKDLGELYALKLMLPAAAASAAARERFSREAKAAAKLKSEHVARATDFGFLPDDGPPYMVLELLSGENLAERLTARGVLDPKDLARLMLDACEALREAHEEGIIHRDLKPTNLFVVHKKDGSECLKVLDFGIAKTIAQDAGALTKTATTMGSPFYMSPEQMRSAKSADARSDIWSMGVTMYELATGTVPFVGETVTEVAILVIEAAVVSPKVHRPELPDAFVEIVMRCLQKNAGRRYADIDDLAEALAAFAGEKWTRLRPRDATVVNPTGDHVLDSASIAMANTDLDSRSGETSRDPSSAKPSSSSETIAAAPISVREISQSAPVTSPAASNTAKSAPPSSLEVAQPIEKVPPTKRSAVWPVALVGGAAALGAAGFFFFGAEPPPETSRANTGPAPAAAEEAPAELPVLGGATGSASAPARSAPSDAQIKAYRDALLVVLNESKAGMQACFDLAAKDTPDLSGKVTLAFEVMRDGVPKGFRVLPDDAMSEKAKDAFGGAVASCFTGVIASKTFPPALSDEEAHLKFPFVFESEPKAVAVAQKMAPSPISDEQAAAMAEKRAMDAERKKQMITKAPIANAMQSAAPKKKAPSKEGLKEPPPQQSYVERGAEAK